MRIVVLTYVEEPETGELDPVVGQVEGALREPAATSTPGASFVMGAAAAGIDQAQAVTRIVDLALARHDR